MGKFRNPKDILSLSANESIAEKEHLVVFSYVWPSPFTVNFTVTESFMSWWRSSAGISGIDLLMAYALLLPIKLAFSSVRPAGGTGA